MTNHKTMKHMALDYLETEHSEQPNKAVSFYKIKEHIKATHGPDHMPSGINKRISNMMEELAEEGAVVHVKGSFKLPPKSSRRTSARALTKTKAGGVAKPKATKATKAKAAPAKKGGGRAAAASATKAKAKAPAKRAGGRAVSAKKGAAAATDDLPKQTPAQAKKAAQAKREEMEALHARGEKAEETTSEGEEMESDEEAATTTSEEEAAPAPSRRGRRAAPPSEEEMETEEEEEGETGTSESE